MTRTEDSFRSGHDVLLAAAAPADAAARGPGHPVKAVDLLVPQSVIETRADGVQVVRCAEPLGPYPDFLTDRLDHWAQEAPDRLAFAQRDADGEWRTINYGQLLTAVRSVGEALAARGLSAQRPVAILSENDIDQAILVLAGQYVGVPVAPVSPAYSLISHDFARLRHVLGLVRPGLIFVNDATRFHKALAALDLADTEIVSSTAAPAGLTTTPFAALLATRPGAAGDAARARRRPEDTAKILFTSGSTGIPKGVINTHRMIVANQQMIAQVYRCLCTAPPVILDWLPWHHTFGGNHNFGLTIYNGGSFYIDDGKPTPGGIGKTIRNLMEVSPTAYFNVPRGYADLLRHLDDDPVLAARFFRDVQFLFYSGAALDQKLWDGLRAACIRAIGQSVPMLTSLGSTETAPMSISSTHIAPGPGEIGLPAPGVEAKLVPCGDKLELRLRGPHVMPGYLGQPELNATCFDEEGFYIIGDAVRFVDAADPDRGLAFDGRLAEDFKLNTGTWVNVATIKAKLMAAFAPYARDVVVVGADLAVLAALLIPDARNIARDFGDGAAEAFTAPALLARFQSILDGIPARGSSERVDRIAILDGELSLDQGEITDKGSINPRKITANRGPLIAELYAQAGSQGRVLVRTTA